jgi:hypothetical protein
MGLKVYAILVVLGSALLAQQPAPVGYDDTPMQPNGKWRVHDGKRPQPKVVKPGDAVNMSPAPQDATVLIGSRADLSAWQMMDGAPVTWAMSDGVLATGKGLIRTKAEFTDFQLHVEFATPKEVKGDSQGRGNSGVFLHGRYEIQVLDSFENPTYADGQASSIYGQWPPLVNAARKPGEWQSYDIVFHAAKFKDGQVEQLATVTVFHNGVLTHEKQPILGPTQHRQAAKESAYDGKGPISLQDHGNPTRFRNVWIRPIKGYDGE